MARLQDGTVDVRLEGIRTPTEDNDAANKAYVDANMGGTPNNLTITAWPAMYAADFTVPVGSYWRLEVAGQERVFQYTGHQENGLNVTMANFSDYIPQHGAEFWTELGSENASNTYPATFRQLFFVSTGSVWNDGSAYYLSRINVAIHNTATLSTNRPSDMNSNWVRIDDAPLVGITSVATDSTLGGNGADVDLTVLGLSSWAVGKEYDQGNMVIYEDNLQIYRARTTIASNTIENVANIEDVVFGTASGFTDRRYIIRFDPAPIAVDTGQTYRFDITGAIISVSFTVSGGDINAALVTNHWVIDPDASSFAIVSGSNPITTRGPVTSITGSIGAAVPNLPPDQAPLDWEAVSAVPLNYNQRYSQAVGEVLSWTEGTTTLNGKVTQVAFESVTAARSSVTGTGANVRYTVTGLEPALVASMVAADRVVLTSGRDALRTVGIATQGGLTSTVVFQGTALQSDGQVISDREVVGNIILARGAIAFEASFAAVDIVADATGTTSVVATRDGDELVIRANGSTSRVNLGDIRQGIALPTTADSGEVFQLTAVWNGRNPGLYQFDSAFSLWRLADSAFDDVEINTLTVDTSLQIPAHNDPRVADDNDAAAIGDLLTETERLRQEFGHSVAPRAVLEEEPDTSYLYDQSIELTGELTTPLFRHARRVDRTSEYPTLPTSNSSRTALVLAAFPDAPLRGRQGLHGTHRIDQYMPTANAGRIGGTVPLERATSGTDNYQLDESFLDDGGIADNILDPAIEDPNAKFLLGQDNGELISHDPAAGTFTTPTNGLLIGMAFKADQIPDTHTGQLPIWSMDFQARSQSDVRNVGMFLEGAASTSTTSIGSPISVASFGGLARLDIAFSDTPEPAHDQRLYTLTTANGTVITFRANDNNGNHITTDTGFTGDRIWRIPRALVTTFPAANNASLGEFRDTVTSLTTTTPANYHMRIKTGTGNNSLLNTVDGLVEIVADTSYYLVSHLSVLTNSSNENRLSVVTYLYNWDADTGVWELFSNTLGHATTLTGFNVNVLSSTEAIDVINPEIRIGLAEYQNNASIFNNNLTMSKIFIAKVEQVGFSEADANAIINDTTPFNGLAQNESTVGYEFGRLPYVDVPYTAYNGTDPELSFLALSPTWLIPDEAQAPNAAAFRNALPADGSWVPVSEVLPARGTFSDTSAEHPLINALPTQGQRDIASSAAGDLQLWIHPTGTGYVDPISTSTALPVGPMLNGMSTSTDVTTNSLTVPQGPISALDYHTLTSTQTSPVIVYRPSSQFDRSKYLGGTSHSVAGVARIYAVPRAAVRSVSYNLGADPALSAGVRNLYVPEYRNDWRAAQTPPLPALTTADFDPSTHYVLGNFFDGRAREIYFTVGGFDGNTGLISNMARIDNTVADSGPYVTGRHTELMFSGSNITDNLSIHRYASFQFSAPAPVNPLESAGGRGDVLPFGMFGLLDLFFGVLGETGADAMPPIAATDDDYYETWTRRGAVYYWYPNRDSGNGQWQNYIGAAAPTDTQWRINFIG